MKKPMKGGAAAAAAGASKGAGGSAAGVKDSHTRTHTHADAHTHASKPAASKSNAADGKPAKRAGDAAKGSSKPGASLGDMSFDDLISALDARLDADTHTHTRTHTHTDKKAGAVSDKQSKSKPTPAVKGGKLDAANGHASTPKGSAAPGAKTAAKGAHTHTHTRAHTHTHGKGKRPSEEDEDNAEEDAMEDDDSIGDVDGDLGGDDSDVMDEEEAPVERKKKSEMGGKAGSDGAHEAPKAKKGKSKAGKSAREAEDEDGVPEPDAPDFAGHREELAHLKEADPEFYEFLLNNDKTLLEFGKDEEEEDEDEDADGSDAEGGIVRDEDSEADDDSEGDVGDLSDEEDAGSDGGAASAAATKRKRARNDRSSDAGEEPSRGPPELTPELFKSIVKSAVVDKTWKGLQKLMHAYRAACFMGESSDILTQLGLLVSEQDSKMKKARAKKATASAGDRSAQRKRAEDEDAAPTKALKFRVTSSAVFMKVITTTLRDAEPLLAAHLGPLKRKKNAAAGADGGATGPTPRALLYDYAGWERMASLVKAFLHSTLHLLREAQDPALLQFLLRAVRPYIPYLQPFHRLIRNWLKVLQQIFASTEDQTLRVAAFLRVRHMAMALPQPTLDTALKGLYLAFVRTAKYMSEAAAPNIMFMANCIAELYGVDETAAYQHAFIYVRQLALHLRSALTTKSKQALSNVLSWQFVNCLKLWGLVLSKYATDASRPLFQLVYPVVQIMLGTIRLMPSARYYPLRLHIAGMLTELSWSTGVYIPIAPLLLEILHAPMMSNKPKGAAASVPPLLHVMVKVSDGTIATRAFQEAVANRVFDLLLDTMKTQYCSVAFPEICVPVIASLRGFVKTTRVAAWRHRAKALIDAFTSQAQKVSLKRDALRAAPADRAAMAAFMSAEATALREERARLRASAAAAEAEAVQVAARAREASSHGSKRRVSFVADADSDGASDDDGAPTRAAAGTKRRRDGDDAGRKKAAPRGKPKKAPKVRGAAVGGDGDDVVEDINPDDL